MEILRSNFVLTSVLLLVLCLTLHVHADYITCFNRKSKCFLKKIYCPSECPSTSISGSHAKVCSINCNKPTCLAECRHKKPNCNGPGAACQDPRFIGADGIVFYFHGQRNQHFTLFSDTNLQINAKFIGLRPPGRPRDFTWIQALGVLFGSQSLTVEATKSRTYDDQIEHLKFSFNGFDLEIPKGLPSRWEALDKSIKVERSSEKNSVLVTLQEVAEISVTVVPVTKQDDRVHDYHVPDDDCFAHLDVQFRFHGVSSKVEGVLGRTYQVDFMNPAKPGVEMAVMGGEDRYRTESLLSPSCGSCVFSGDGGLENEDLVVMENEFLDCSGGLNSGNGIVCRK